MPASPFVLVWLVVISVPSVATGTGQRSSLTESWVARAASSFARAARSAGFALSA